jgi:hypothetical protein
MFVKRSCLILCSTAASVVVLALPGLARAESTDGWSWNDGAAAVANSSAGGNASVDGWSWGDQVE